MQKFFYLLLMAVVFLSTPSPVDAAAFRMGDYGEEVQKVQRALASAGYDISVDGDFGPATEDAVKRYQKDNGLEVDGLVGPAVYTSLFGTNFPEISRGTSSYVADSRRILTTAMHYMGVPYVYGGASPSGFDCSGFVQYVFAQSGISLPRTADVQYYAGIPVNKSDLQPGDLVFFAGDYTNISHVGIYVGNGDFVHASTEYGIAIDSLYRDYRVDHYAGACRILR